MLLRQPLRDHRLALRELDRLEEGQRLADGQVGQARRCGSPSTVTRERLRTEPCTLARPAGGFAHELFELLARGVESVSLCAVRCWGARPRSSCSTSAVARSGSCSGRRSPRRIRTARRRAPAWAASSTVCRARSRGPRRPPRGPGTSTRACCSPTPSAPSLMDRVGSGTTRSASTSSRVPSPSQVGHAPYGELNEKFRGASSSNDSPQNVQASFCERLQFLVPFVGGHRDRRDPLRQLERGLDAVRDTPPDALLGDETVDDDLDRVLEVLGEPDRLRELPDLTVDPRARKPFRASSWSSFSYSPLRPRIAGARTWKRVPSGSWST